MKLQCREVFGQQFRITTQKYSINIFLILMTDAKESSVTINPRPVLMLMSSKCFGLAVATVRPTSFLVRISCPHLSEEETLLTWLSSFSCLSFMVSSSKALLKKKHEST